MSPGVYTRTLPNDSSPWCHSIRVHVLQLNTRMDVSDLLLMR